MRTFLIPVPRHASAQKIKQCLSLMAKPGRDKLHLLHVITLPPSVTVMEMPMTGSEYMLEDVKKEEEKELAFLAKELSSFGYTVDVHSPIGFFEQEFVTLANRIHPDFILMFTDGAHSWLDQLLGTNTSHVLQKLKSPVFVFPNHVEVTRLKKADVAIDMEHDDYSVYKNVLDLADELDIELSFIKIDSDMQLDIIPDKSILNGLQKAYPGKIKYIVHRKDKDPVRGLEDYAEESHADFIVLYTTKRNPIDKLFHKSITKNLVLHSKVPLLIYHYEGGV